MNREQFKEQMINTIYDTSVLLADLYAVLMDETGSPTLENNMGVNLKNGKMYKMTFSAVEIDKNGNNIEPTEGHTKVCIKCSQH